MRILNAVAGRGYTSRKKADEYVRSGKAVWSHGGMAIKFIACQAAVLRSAIMRALKPVDIGYDHCSGEGIAPVDAARNVPVVMVHKLYRDPSKSPRRDNGNHGRFSQRPGPVRVIVADGKRRDTA